MTPLQEIEHSVPTTQAHLGMRRVYVGATLAVVLVVAAARIVVASRTWAQTIDERVHVAAGLEWLEFDSYQRSPENPPLARVAVAAGPYLLGARAVKPSFDLNAVFRTEAGQRTTLLAARAGNLPFLFAAALLVYIWARRQVTTIAAILAVVGFLSIPPVLGHSGLATTDIAAAAMFGWALFLAGRWIEQPTPQGSVALGAIVGLAVLAKFSLIPFLGLAVALGFIARGRTGSGRVTFRRWCQLTSIAALIAALTLWAGYKFSLGPLVSASDRPHAALDARLPAEGPVHDFVYAAIEAPLYPAPAFLRGLFDLSRHNLRGHRAFLLGDVYQHGRWDFFPLLILLKTPLPFLMLAGMGTFLAIRDFNARSSLLALLPLLGIGGVLILATLSRINIGLRHVLPAYPLAAVLSAYALDHIRSSGSRGRRSVGVIAAVLLAWLVATSILAHPRYVGWANFLAGKRPERIFVDSDLDWGQDVALLTDAMRECPPDRTYLALFSNADLAEYGLDRFRSLDDRTPSDGCVAISLTLMKLWPERYEWLESREPQRRIGDSILLYRIEESPSRVPDVTR